VIQPAFGAGSGAAILTASGAAILTVSGAAMCTVSDRTIRTAFGCALVLAAFTLPQASLAASTSPTLEPGSVTSAAAKVEGVAVVAHEPGVWFDGKQRQRYPVSRLADLESSLLLTVRAASTERIRSAVAALGHRLDATRIPGVFLLQIGQGVEPLAAQKGQSAAGQDPLEVSLKLEGMEGIESIELNRRLMLRSRSQGR